MNILFWSIADFSLDIVYLILYKLDLLIIYLPRYAHVSRKYLFKAIKAAANIAWWSIVVLAVIFEYSYPLAKRAISTFIGYVASALFILYGLYRRYHEKR